MKNRMLFQRTGLFPLPLTFILGASILCGTTIAIRLPEDKPNPKIDYITKINEIARANRPATLNAAPYYEKAITLYIDPPNKMNIREADYWLLELTPQQMSILRKWVQVNSDALTQLHKGSRMPYYWSEYKGEFIWDIKLPLLEKALNLARAITWDAKLKVAERNVGESMTDIVTCYRFGLHISSAPLLVEQLVGMKIISKALETAFCILDRTQFDKEAITSLQSEIEQLSDGQTYLFNLEAEKLKLLDIIQRIFTDDGKGGGQIHLATAHSILSMISDPTLTQEKIQALRELRRGQTVKAAHETFKYLDVVLRKTPWEWKNEKINVQEELEKLTEGNPLVQLLMPNITGLSTVSVRRRSEKDALITTLALLRYKADKGQFPITLHQLVLTGYLRKLPTDPYSDKALVYKRIKDNFTLYSIGADFDDDGGIPSKWGEGEQGGDQVFWPFPIQLKDLNK